MYLVLGMCMLFSCMDVYVTDVCMYGMYACLLYVMCVCIVCLYFVACVIYVCALCMFVFMCGLYVYR